MNYTLDSEGKMFFSADSFDRDTLYCSNAVGDWSRLGNASAACIDGVSTVVSNFDVLESKIEKIARELENLKCEHNAKKNNLRSQLKTLNY